MKERSITYLSDAFLITCVLQKDLAEEVLAAAKNIGAQGATMHRYSRTNGALGRHHRRTKRSYTDYRF